MTSHLNSHRTTDIKPEMLSCVQTGNGTPHDIYNIRGIAHTQTNRKDEIFMQSQLVQNFTFILEGVKGLVHWRSKHGAGHIPLCGIFSNGTNISLAKILTVPEMKLSEDTKQKERKKELW